MSTNKVERGGGVYINGEIYLYYRLNLYGMGDIALGRRSDKQCMVDSDCDFPGILCKYCADADNNDKMEITYYYCVNHKGLHMQSKHKN